MDYSIEYNDFNEETQLFLNKVMEIYSATKDQKIERMVKDVISTNKYVFTKLDKKILAFFTAGQLVEGNIKNIFSQYDDDIKLDDLLNFMYLTESDIKPLENDDYVDFYNKYIKYDLATILDNLNPAIKIKVVSPEVIIKSLQFVDGTDIFDYYKDKYKVGTEPFFFEHPLFKTLDIYIKRNGLVVDREQKKSKSKPRTTDVLPFLLPPEVKNFKLFETFPAMEHQIQVMEPQEEEETEEIDDKKDENVWQILDDIKKKFIGQETASENIFYNIINNQKLAEMQDIPDGQRSIIFIDGPTGTGKTAIVREISEKLGVPFSASPITNYSSTGYVGDDFEVILEHLYKKADGDLELAQRGIVILDEFDKIAYSNEKGLEMHRAVQQQLLDFLGGGKYSISTGKSFFGGETEFDTSKLTFVCLGALTNLRSEKTDAKPNFGFGQNEQSESKTYSINPQDLINLGLEKELVGRFNTYLHTEEYSKATLEKILRESTISPLIGFKKWVENFGLQLEIDEDVYALIAEQAYELNTGARSLQTIMNNIRTRFIKDVLRKTTNTIHLDSETVKEIYGQTMTRKGRE